MRNFTAVLVFIMLIVIGTIGAGGYYFFYKPSANLSASPSPSPSLEPSPSPSPELSPSPEPSPTPAKKTTTPPKVSSVPLVDCVGPDGKSVKLSQSACDSFKKAWASPSPTPQPSPQASTQATGCAAYNTGGDLGTLTVNIQAQSGSLSGDAGVTISRKYPECSGVDPGFPLTQVISQGSTSTSFSGMRPGPFHIDVLYHGNTTGNDVNINSGGNSTTVTVSN